MLKVFQGQRPDLTPAQTLGGLLAGIPVVATLLHVFGAYDMSSEQQDALKEAVQWAGLLALGLFGADAGLRAARNHATAKVSATGIAAQAEPNALPAKLTVPTSKDDLSGASTVADPDLPDDEQEFGLAPSGQGGDDEDDFEPNWDDEDDEYHPDHDAGPESRLEPVPPEEGER
jgi:hypothetical protein